MLKAAPTTIFVYSVAAEMVTSTNNLSTVFISIDLIGKAAHTMKGAFLRLTMRDIRAAVVRACGIVSGKPAVFAPMPPIRRLARHMLHEVVNHDFTLTDGFDKARLFIGNRLL